MNRLDLRKNIIKVIKILIIDSIVSFILMIISVIVFSGFYKQLLLKIKTYRGTANLVPGEELGVETVTIYSSFIYPSIFILLLILSGIKHYYLFKKKTYN